MGLNGLWIDLNLAHGEKQEMRSGLRRRVVQDEAARTWTAEFAVPMRSLTPAFDPKRSWRAGGRDGREKEQEILFGVEPDIHAGSGTPCLEAFERLAFREAGNAEGRDWRNLRSVSGGKRPRSRFYRQLGRTRARALAGMIFQ